MAKTKKREKFYLWMEPYEQFKSIASRFGISASVLFRQSLEEMEPPNESPKKARDLMIDQKTDAALQDLADSWFSSSSEVPGNRSDAVNYVIMHVVQKELDLRRR